MTGLIRLRVDESCLEQGVRFVGFADDKILDEVKINQIGEELLGLFDKGNPNYHPTAHICMDFSGADCGDFENVGFFASMGLARLITADKRHVAQYNRHLGMVNMAPNIYESFVFTKLTSLFNIVDNREEYLARFCA
jgi:hypothetical protein